MLQTIPLVKEQHPVVTNLVFALNNGVFPPTVAGTSSDIINRNEQGTEKIKVTHEIVLPEQIKKLRPAVSEKPAISSKLLNIYIPKPQSKPKRLTLDQILNGMIKK